MRSRGNRSHHSSKHARVQLNSVSNMRREAGHSFGNGRRGLRVVNAGTVQPSCGNLSPLQSSPLLLMQPLSCGN